MKLYENSNQKQVFYVYGGVEADEEKIRKSQKNLTTLSWLLWNFLTGINMELITLFC